MPKLPPDYHMHSHHSGDSEAPMEDMIKSAIKAGLPELCFTEHMDFDFPETDEIAAGTFELDAATYRREWEKMEERFKEEIVLKFGVELGLQEISVEKNRAFIAENDFDFIIGSVHLDNGKDPYMPDFYDGITEEEALRLHLTNTIANLRAFHDFDVLGHLDFVTRCFPSGDPHYDVTPFLKETEEILELLLQYNIGLEINTHPLRTYDDWVHPAPPILRRYYEMGGRVITFGADAHRKENVGAGFANALRIASDAGFSAYCTYKKRERTFVDFP